MPWSEWQTSPISVQGWIPDVTVFEKQVGGIDVSAGTAVETAVAWRVDSGVRAGGLQLTLGDEWLTARNWSPDGLSSLTLDTDYAVRPDREPGDIDAFVEYEDVPSTPDSLFFGGLLVQSSTTYPITFHFGYVLGTEFVPLMAMSSFPAMTTLHTTPGDGEDYVDLSSVFPTSSLFPNGSARSIFVGVEFTGTPPSGLDHSEAAILRPALALRYRMPRWRYWIPGDRYLRLRQRDDGLGGSTRRLRAPTSQQSSPRLRGYDYRTTT